MLPYNAILGYPALAKFMAVTHHGFNVLKIPSDHGTIIMRYNEKDALRSVEHMYREAATMFPADEDLLEHSGDLAKKKQLLSQSRAAAKRAAFVAAHPGEHSIRAPGKKQDASPPSEPGEDLTSPMSDMSLGGVGQKTPFHSRAHCNQEDPTEGWGMQGLPHHWGRAFPQIGKHAHHLPMGKC
jgi:hypothetical protein